MGIGRPLAPVAARTQQLIAAAGAQGLSCAEIRAAFNPEHQETARKSALNGVHLGRLWNLRSRRLTVYYAPGVDRAEAEASFAVRVAERDTQQQATTAARRARYLDRLASLAHTRRQGREDLEAQREARRQQAEQSRLEREAQRIERERAKRQRAAIRRDETSLTNRLARKIKGTTSGIVMEPPKPAAAIDWSRAVVTVAPRKLGRYEVLPQPGQFSAARPGQYSDAPASCAARATC